MKKLIIIVIFGLINLPMYSQSPDWNTQGNPAGTTDFLGTTNNINLNFQRNNFSVMDFGSTTWTGLNGLGPLANSNRISFGLNGETTPAWSMLHLWSNSAGTLTGAMQRPWMNIGLSMSGNLDFLYLGMLERPITGGPNLATDMVMAWGCQDAAMNNDNFRFLYLESLSANPNNDDRTVQGREIMRLAPTGNVGIGDFSTMVWPGGAGLAQQPTHKLDVDGTVRLRQMSEDSPDVLITGVEQNTTGDYELQYKTLSGDPDEYLGGDGNWYEVSVNGDCDWETSGNDIYMGTLASCATGNVAIGQLPIVNSRLSIEEVADDGESEEFGQRILVSGFEPGITLEKTGLYSEVRSNVQKWNKAVDGYARDGNNNIGIKGRAYFGDNNYAVRGEVGGSGSNYAIYGTSPNTPNDWAGYFVGKTFCTAGAWSASDENLKQNIQNIDDALALLQAIEVKTYEYRTEEFPQLNLASGQQYGVLAQNLEEVMPNAVTSAYLPEQYDEEGNVASEAVDFKGVDYNQLIPLLIQATKEQQAEMDTKNERIDELEAQIQALADMVAQCCAMQDKNNQENTGQNDIQIDKNLLKQNTPNPFDLNTTIEYYLAQAGQVSVKITNAQGQLVDVLVSENQDQGSHKIQWNAKGITRGVYYYSLTINGEEMVKRMVKL